MEPTDRPNTIAQKVAFEFGQQIADSVLNQPEFTKGIWAKIEAQILDEMKQSDPELCFSGEKPSVYFHFSSEFTSLETDVRFEEWEEDDMHTQFTRKELLQEIECMTQFIDRIHRRRDMFQRALRR